MADIIYTYKNEVYANITNKCDCACTFCIRSQKNAIGNATSLWHTVDPTYDEIIAAIGISGVPDEVRQFALLAQKITSLLLREQEIDTLNYGYKNQENAIVRCLIENKAVNQDFLKEFLD